MTESTFDNQITVATFLHEAHFFMELYLRMLKCFLLFGVYTESVFYLLWLVQTISLILENLALFSNDS